MELYSFFRWLIQGLNNLLLAEQKPTDQVHKRAMSFAQSTVSLYQSDCQLKNKKWRIVRSAAGRWSGYPSGSKKQRVDKHYAPFWMSIDSNRVLRVDPNRIKCSQTYGSEWGCFSTSRHNDGKACLFAIDSVEFAEDTPDGKRTVHGTAMAIYQRRDPQDKCPDLNVDTTNQGRSFRDLEYIISLLECPEPPSKPIGPVYPRFSLLSKDELPIRVEIQDFAWVLGRSLTRRTVNSTQVTETQANVLNNPGSNNQSAKTTDVPVW